MKAKNTGNQQKDSNSINSQGQYIKILQITSTRVNEHAHAQLYVYMCVLLLIYGLITGLNQFCCHPKMSSPNSCLRKY